MEDDRLSLNLSASNSSQYLEDLSKTEDVTSCPRDLAKGTYLKPIYFVLNDCSVFFDKLLPKPSFTLLPDNLAFTTDYYDDLHFKVSLFNNFNHLGACIPLKHSKLNVKRFRELLPQDYDDSAILQYMEFGFPLGLQEDFYLHLS